jgi:hypothetical protein
MKNRIYTGVGLIIFFCITPVNTSVAEPESEPQGDASSSDAAPAPTAPGPTAPAPTLVLYMVRK